MTDAPTAIAFLPSSDAPNRLATVHAAVALARAVEGASVLLLPGDAGLDDLVTSGVGRVIRIEGLAEVRDGSTAAQAFVAAAEAAGLQLDRAAILLPFGAVEEEAAAGIAVALDGTIMGKCSAIELTGQGCTVERPVYGGRATARLRAKTGPFVCIVRPGLAVTLDPSAGEAAVEIVAVEVGAAAPVVQRIASDAPRRQPLESARIIVSGGRGMGSAEGFGALEQLASAIGGVVACSLAAADAGWYPVSRQVGQSGKFVSPDLYIAVGVSGMSQHMAGIAESAPIFAINNDPDSSIWEIAEVGVKDDWRAILPPLLEALSA